MHKRKALPKRGASTSRSYFIKYVFPSHGLRILKILPKKFQNTEKRDSVEWCSSKRIKSNPAEEKWIELSLSFNVCVKFVAPESIKKMVKKKRKKKNLHLCFWSRKWQPIPVFLTGKFHGQRSLTDYSPWVHKESNITKHVSIYVWESQNRGIINSFSNNNLQKDCQCPREIHVPQNFSHWAESLNNGPESLFKFSECQ